LIHCITKSVEKIYSWHSWRCMSEVWFEFRGKSLSCLW